MSISGLVVTLTADADRADDTIRRLRAEPWLELGPRSGQRLAIVAETGSTRDDRELLERVAAVPGVLSAHVVFVQVVPPSGPAEPQDPSPDSGGFP